MTGQHSGKMRQRVWDPLVRIFHWVLAAAFATAWFIRSDSFIHETAGKVVLSLIILRTAWGLTGTGAARFETFIKGPIATSAYVFSILRGKPRHFIGHNPAGAAMIAALLLCLTVTTASGILMTTTAFWGGVWVEWVHGWAATLCVWLIAGHVLGVIAASLQHRENLPLAMITGRKWVPAGTLPHLGAMAMGWRRMLAATLVVILAVGAWNGGRELFDASFWRMHKMVAAEFARKACKVTAVAGPHIEIYPNQMLRYDVAIIGRATPVAASVPAALALQRRPQIDVAQAVPDCRMENLRSNLSLYRRASAIAPEMAMAPVVRAASKPPAEVKPQPETGKLQVAWQAMQSGLAKAAASQTKDAKVTAKRRSGKGRGRGRGRSGR